MSSFDIRLARNAPFDPEIDAALMAMAASITEETFPPAQDCHDLHVKEP